MWRVSRKSDGFVLAESVVSLIILSIAISLLTTCYQGINYQRQRLTNELIAARLAKEVSDRLVATDGDKATVRRNDFYAYACASHVAVYQRQRLVLRVS